MGDDQASPNAEESSRAGSSSSSSLEDTNTNDDSRNPNTPNTDTNNNKIGGLRGQVGHASVVFSDWINDNLIMVRYVGLAAIGVLTAYGLSQTPLFFRYRTVAEIPAHHFRTRRCLRGRLLRRDDKSDTTRTTSTQQPQPIRCWIRHLSPAERFLSPRLFERLVLSWNPAAAVGISPRHNKRDLLHVEIAGLESIVVNTGGSAGADAWLDQLARQHTAVTVQLLGRRRIVRQDDEQHQSLTTSTTMTTTTPHHHHTNKKKRQIPGLSEAHSQMASSSSLSINDDATDQIAVARLYFRPQRFQWLSTDLGYHMVRWGRANICEQGLFGGTTSTTTTSSSSSSSLHDTSHAVKDLRADAAYMDRLAAAELQAAAESRGQWADPTIRQERRDVVQEAEFQASASIWQKLWRRLRGG